MVERRQQGARQRAAVVTGRMNAVLSQELLRPRVRQASVRAGRRRGGHLARHQAVTARNRTEKGHGNAEEGRMDGLRTY